MLEKRYGGRKKAQAAAKTIQEAYRSYQMNKRYQHLKRTHSVESRISRYLDHHQQLRQTMQEWGMHSSRARVMMIEDNEIAEEGPDTKTKAVRQLVEELNNADNQKVRSSSMREVTVSSSSQSTAEQSSGKDDDDLHRNNSNNVTPKPGAIPSGETVEGPRLERNGSQTFVVTLTMCKHQDSESEDNIASEPSSTSSPRNTLTRDSSTKPQKTTTHVERTTEISQRGAVTLIQKESSTTRTISNQSAAETPATDKATKKVLDTDSNVKRKLDLGEKVGETTTDVSPESDSHGSHGSANNSMSPLEDAEQLAQVVWTESPLFRAEPPDFKAYTKTSSPVDSKEAVKALESDLEAAKMEDSANYQNNNMVESKQDAQDKSKAGGDRAGAENRKQKPHDGATSSDISPEGVAMEMAQQKGVKAAMGSEDDDEQGPMTPVGADFDDKFDQISVASTVTSDNEKDVPAVTIASPEGSMKILEEMGEESTSSSDSDMSDDDEPLSGRRKKQQAMQAIYNQQAARANKQFAKVHSNRMDSPVWKRKSMDTKVASSGSRSRIINGTPSGRMTRSETGDSMSSESSGSSSKYTYEDTSSMADDSVDSLSGESSLFDTSSIERHIIPTQTQTLSIPMTPMRKRRYRIGVNLFNK